MREGPAAQDPLPGQLVAGRFRIEKKVGQGGMAAVYLALDEARGEPVAVKFLPVEVATQAEFLRRFEREVQIMRDLDHPHVVRMHGHGTHEDRPWYAMDFLAHPDLEKLLEGGRTLPLPEALMIGLGIAKALDYVHTRDLVHRDLKPSNVIVKPGPHPVLMDFGLVLASNRTQLTATGALVGTPLYMSPEMVRGSQVGPASDLYQTGLILYEALSGKQAQRGKDIMEVATRCLSGDFPPIEDAVPGLPPAWAATLGNLLATEPEARYPRAADLVRDLERIRRGQPVARSTGSAPGPGSGAETTAPVGPMGSRTDPARAATPSPRPLGASEPRRLPGPGSVTASGAGFRTGAIPVQTVDGRPWRAPLIALGLAVLVAAGFFMPGFGNSVPQEIRVVPGLAGFAVEWTTTARSIGRIEVREPGGGEWREVAAASDRPTRTHRVEADGFAPGSRVEFRFRLPDGTVSEPRPVEIDRLRLVDLEVAAGPEGPELRVRLDRPAGLVLQLAGPGGGDDLAFEAGEGNRFSVRLPPRLPVSFAPARVVVETPSGEIVPIPLQKALEERLGWLLDQARSLDLAALVGEAHISDTDLSADLAKLTGNKPSVDQAGRLQQVKTKAQAFRARLETALGRGPGYPALQEIVRLLPWAIESPDLGWERKCRVYEALSTLYEIAWWARDRGMFEIESGFPEATGVFWERRTTGIAAPAEVAMATPSGPVQFGSVSLEGRSVQHADYEIHLVAEPGPDARCELEIGVEKKFKDDMGLRFTVNDRVTLTSFGVRRDLKVDPPFFHGLPGWALKKGANAVRVEVFNMLGTFSARAIRLDRLSVRVGK